MDARNNFITVASGADETQQVVRWSDGKRASLGAPFEQALIINDLVYKDDHLVVVTFDRVSGISKAWFFNGNEWQPIATTDYFVGVFVHKGRVFGFTTDGIVAELVYG